MDARICQECGKTFIPDHPRSRYCCEACREAGKRARWQQWKDKSGYNAQARDRMRKKRDEARDKRARQDAETRADSQRRGEESAAQAQKTLEEKAAGGDYFAQMLLSRQRGDIRAYWEAYRNYEISEAEKRGKISGRVVNGISVYFPDFVDRILQAVADKEIIICTIEKTYQESGEETRQEGGTQ